MRIDLTLKHNETILINGEPFMVEFSLNRSGNGVNIYLTSETEEFNTGRLRIRTGYYRKGTPVQIFGIQYWLSTTYVAEQFAYIQLTKTKKQLLTPNYQR